MVTMEKQLVGYYDLLKKVEGVVARYPECQSISVGGLSIYKEPKDGVTWRAILENTGEHSELGVCQVKIVEDIRALRMAYDVRTS